MYDENALQVRQELELTAQPNMGIQILKRAKQAAGNMPLNMGELAGIINSSSSLSTFVKGIEKGQKLALDISKEVMEKIENGDLQIMTTKEGVMKAEICYPNGAVKQHMNLKYEEFTKIPDMSALVNAVQMQSINAQLAVIVDQLESIGIAIGNVLQGQQNDRLALYKSGEQLYEEATAIKNREMRQSLTALSLKTLEDARMQMIESIKTDIGQIAAYHEKKAKLKPEEIEACIMKINCAFDVINQVSFLKAGIYYKQGEIEAMALSLKKYAGFLTEQICPNAQLLYYYDREDKFIKGGRWDERVKTIPQTIEAFIEQCSNEYQRLELDYATLEELGVLDDGSNDMCAAQM